MDDAGAGKAGAISEVGGLCCSSKPLLSMLALAAKLSKWGPWPHFTQVSRAWRDMAPGSTKLCCMFVPASGSECECT